MKMKRFSFSDVIQETLDEIKKVGGKYYMHKFYAEKYIPSDIYSKAINLLNQHEPGLEFHCITWNPKQPETVEFDVSSEFGNVTEPLVDRRVKVNTSTGEVIEGKGNLNKGKLADPSVWHGSGDFWVDKDFPGFDVQKARDWRKEYLQAMKDYPMLRGDGKSIQPTPVGGSRAAWLNHLMHIHKIDRYFELNGINTMEDKLAYLQKWSGGQYTDLVDRYKKYLADNHLNTIIQEALDELEFDKRFKPIEDFDLPIYADDADWEHDDDAIDTELDSERQEIGSADTSLAQIPRTFKMKNGITFSPNTHNFDIGGGEFDLGSEALMNGYTEPTGNAVIGQKVVNLIFDPYNRESSYNNAMMDKIEELGGADTVTVNNCLNVIKGRKFIERVIRQACEAVKPEGEVVFQIYSGDSKKNGIGGRTRAGYQQNKKAEKYVPLIHKWFDKLWIDKGGNCIIAKEPHFDITDRVPFYPDKDGEPRYLNIKR